VTEIDLRRLEIVDQCEDVGDQILHVERSGER
jgi:hypothetical protein